MNNMNTLVDEMIFSNILKSPKIIDAFRAIDRKYFVPYTVEEHAYVDIPLSIGNSQTISQPSTVAFMLEHLDVQNGDTVLDIGSGSGWTTALLCHLAGEKGSVTGLERVEALVEQGKVNLSKIHTYTHCRIKRAGGILGLPGRQFDKILVSASAEEIPEVLFLQLKVGGTLVVPIDKSIFNFKKLAETDVVKEDFYGFVFVPLII